MMRSFAALLIVVSIGVCATACSDGDGAERTSDADVRQQFDEAVPWDHVRQIGSSLSVQATYAVDGACGTYPPDSDTFKASAAETTDEIVVTVHQTEPDRQPSAGVHDCVGHTLRLTASVPLLHPVGTRAIVDGGCRSECEVVAGTSGSMPVHRSRPAVTKYQGERASDGACRNDAMKLIAQVSPPSTARGNPVPRKDSLDDAALVLEVCRAATPDDRDVTEMLASVYLAANRYSDSTPLLRSLATTAPGPEQPNAFYAWGVSATRSGDARQAIQAWRSYLRVTDPGDDRRDRARRMLTDILRAQMASLHDS